VKIRANPFQVTYDIYGDEDGYVGESTGLETAYALVHNKPVVLLRSPTRYSPTISPPIRDIVERYKDAVLVEGIDKLRRSELTDRLAEIALTEVNYGLSGDEVDIVMGGVLEPISKPHAKIPV